MLPEIIVSILLILLPSKPAIPVSKRTVVTNIHSLKNLFPDHLDKWEIFIKLKKLLKIYLYMKEAIWCTNYISNICGSPFELTWLHSIETCSPFATWRFYANRMECQLFPLEAPLSPWLVKAESHSTQPILDYFHFSAYIMCAAVFCVHCVLGCSERKAGRLHWTCFAVWGELRNTY